MAWQVGENESRIPSKNQISIPIPIPKRNYRQNVQHSSLLHYSTNSTIHNLNFKFQMHESIINMKAEDEEALSKQQQQQQQDYPRRRPLSSHQQQLLAPPASPSLKRHKSSSSSGNQSQYKYPGKENIPPPSSGFIFSQAFHQTPRRHTSCGSIESKLLLLNNNNNNISINKNSKPEFGGGGLNCIVGNDAAAEEEDDVFEPNTQFEELFSGLSEEDYDKVHDPAVVLACPLCGLDLSEWDELSRQSHANACLDEDNDKSQQNQPPQKQEEEEQPSSSSSNVPEHVAPVIEWLHSLGLGKYEEAFVEHEIDWETLRWLTQEDLVSIGVTALGPRKKILHSLKQLKDERDYSTNNTEEKDMEMGCSTVDVVVDDKKKQLPPLNRLITDFFRGAREKNTPMSSKQQQQQQSGEAQSERHPEKEKGVPVPVKKKKNSISNRIGKAKDIPSWCCIPGTPFRVDAFRYLRRDCSHWFLTHFHIDHYQGLSRSFSYGKIYCSMITAKLVNVKIGIPWDRIQVMPLNQKINVAGVDVTCYDANHCQGAIIILFEPPNGKAVLHTGDFRFNEELAQRVDPMAGNIHTLILDTTYCDPQYNFPKQEAVIQFVIEAIQAESFNPKTLFLIGSYTIGKERLFLEVARVLHKKIFVNAAKLRLLECLELPPEDMQWITLNEHESHIHVVPMWTIASFKRLKQLSNQYAKRFSLIVAFSPTGWTFGKGKKSAGRRWQQGTIIRYEVPYSEHCSFEELKEFVKLLSPTEIIPSVNNDGEASTNAMLAHLLS